MSGWNAMSFEGKETMLGVVRREAEQFFEMVDSDEVWEAPTGAGHWQVRDVVAHLMDTTEAYFVAFDAARSHRSCRTAYGLPGMAARVDTQALALRSVPRTELVERLRTDFDKMMEIFDGAHGRGLDRVSMVPHFYMGPLPAFFFPAFQLMDYGVHSWDIRQGTGRAHGLSGEAADLLTPFMFVLWKYTTGARGSVRDRHPDHQRPERRRHAGARRAGRHGLRAGGRDGLPTVLEFDPGSFVLTAFGRSNAGTIRGDRAIADRYLNLFFRI